MIFLLQSFVNGSDLLVRPGDKELIETPPRTAVTTFIRIENQSPFSREMVATVSLPQGWKLITEELPFFMSPNSAESRMLSFFVPATALAGSYRVEYRLSARQSPEISDYAMLQVNVLPSQKISLAIINTPRYALAGSSFNITARVGNNSNIPADIVLSGTSSERYSIDFSEKRMRLKPGETKDVTVTVHSVGPLQKSIKHHLSLTARISDGTLSVTDDCFVKIIPASPAKNSQLHYFPVQVIGRRVIQQSGDQHIGYQGEISGEGRFFENSKDKLRFRLTGPDIYSKSYLAEHDEYYVDYSSRAINAHLGDGYFSLSELTERSRYGRGIGVDWNGRRLETGAYYQHTRWLVPSERQAATYLRYKPNRNGFIALNWLNKKRSSGNANIFSLQAKYKSGQSNVAEFEYAQDDQTVRLQNAYRASLVGRASIFRYSLHLISASPHFAGYYRDTRYLTGTLVARLFKNLSVTSTAWREKQNFDIDSTKYSAPLTEYYQLGLNYNLDGFLSLNADYLNSSRRDRLPVAKFDYDEESVRLTVVKSSNKISLNASAEAGTTSNNLLNSRFEMRRYTLSARYSPSSKASLRTFVYYDDNQRYSGEDRQRITAGISLFLKLFNTTDFYLDIQNDYSPEDYYFDRNLFALRLRHRLPFGHQISLTSRHTLLRNTLDNKETALLLEYSIPLDIPVSRKNTTASIFGKVIDAETLEGIGDVFLDLNGSTTVTQQDGSFSFPPIKPGTYQLTVDKLSVGLNRVTLPQLPMEITVTGGDEKFVELGVIDGAQLNGQLYFIQQNELELATANSRMPIQATDGQSTKTGIDDIPLTLSNREITLNRFTQDGGHFSFEGLQPGKWTLKIANNRLPAGIERNEINYQIDIFPGENKTLNLELQQKLRIVNLLRLDHKELVAEERVSDDIRLSKTYEQFIREMELENSRRQPIDTGLLLGMSYMRLKRYGTALQEFRSIIQNSDSEQMVADAIFLTGWCYSKLGKVREARAYFKKLVKDYPASQFARMAAQKTDRSRTLSDHTGKPKDLYFTRGLALFESEKYQDALPFLIKSVIIESKTTGAETALWYAAEGFYRLEQWDYAQKIYSRIRESQMLPRALLRLGIISAKTGNFLLAKYYLGKLIVLDPGSDLATEARQYMDGLYATYLNSPIP